MTLSRSDGQIFSSSPLKVEIPAAAPVSHLSHKIQCFLSAKLKMQLFSGWTTFIIFEAGEFIEFKT